MPSDHEDDDEELDICALPENLQEFMGKLRGVTPICYHSATKIDTPTGMTDHIADAYLTESRYNRLVKLMNMQIGDEFAIMTVDIQDSWASSSSSAARSTSSSNHVPTQGEQSASFLSLTVDKYISHEESKYSSTGRNSFRLQRKVCICIHVTHVNSLREAARQ